MTAQPLIVWFRQDLRLADHPALTAAVESGAPVIPVYVLDDATPGRWALGGASRWWLHHSLAALQRDLAARGADLLLRRGPALEALTALVEETGARAIHFSRCYEPHAAKLESDLAEALGGMGVACRRFGGGLLFEPEAVVEQAGKAYRVFTPFWKACLGMPEPKAPLPAPEAIEPASPWSAGDDLADWRLLPTAPDWSTGIAEAWTPGEAAAGERLHRFLDRAVAAYRDDRDRPDRPATSGLSPHLHFGEIGPRQVWHVARAAANRSGAPGVASGAFAFLREVGWREFSYHLLHHWPDLPSEPFRPDFAAFPWRDDAAALEAWQRGRTGYPIVDAGMRQLWHTGWMHNRVRMVVASFLVKHLLVPWQEGEAWFWDTLVDADLANNAASWQWVAGSGADAAPYFRIFNPVLQGEKFDPDGAYVGRWVPELADLPAKYIHQPWTAPNDVLEQAGVKLGDTYPAPIVDHKAARARALAAFQALKEGN